MMDWSIKIALAAAAAWMLTRRATPANAAAAHRLWLAVALAPLAWLLARGMFSPVVFVHARASVVPDWVHAPDADLLAAAQTAYLVIAALLLARVAAGVIAVRRLLHRSVPLAAGDLMRLRRLASQPSLDIREGDVRAPLTAGFLRAAIVLPHDWRTLRPDGLAAILHHEGAHVARRDCTIALACGLIEAMFWLNPAVWLATSRVRWFAELACDADAAVAMSPHAYASQLLALSNKWNGATPPAYALAVSAKTGIARRLGLLIDDIERGSRRSRFLPAATVALAILLLVSGTVWITARPAPLVASAPAVDPAHAALHHSRHRH